MTPPTHSGRRRGGRSGGKPTTPKSSAHVEPLHPTEIPPDIESFHHWNLGDELQAAIAGMGITNPTPIQRLAIGPVLEGRDVIAKAETGTGKTLGFGAPMMAKIDPARASVLGLVLCPTRELAEQVQKVLAILGAARGVKTALVVGGEPLEPQVRALQAGAQVVVGTPGRVLDLYRQKFLSFPWTEFAVLDEADVMLEIGFIDDVKQILSYTPDERQTLLFSATFPPEILKFAREYTKNPTEVATASGVKTVDKIAQSWMNVEPSDQPLALIRLIEQSADDDVFLVFCPRRGDVDQLIRRLERMPFPVKALHGGYDQEARFRVMSAFRTGEVKALIATDVASRGLDVAHVTHVVNLGSPQDVTDYTHRIGRTGRAGRSGAAISIVSGKDMHKWKRVLREATWPIPEVEPPGSTRMRRGDRDRADRGGRRERPHAREDVRERVEPASEPVAREQAPSFERAPRPEHGHAKRERGGHSARPEREERRPSTAPDAPLPRRERAIDERDRRGERSNEARDMAQAARDARARPEHSGHAGREERVDAARANDGRGERRTRRRASGALRGQPGERAPDAPRGERDAPQTRWPEDRSEERTHAHDVREWNPEASHVGGTPVGSPPARRDDRSAAATPERRPITRDEVREARERGPGARRGHAPHREQEAPRRAEGSGRTDAPARAPRDEHPRTPTEAPRERHGEQAPRSHERDRGRTHAPQERAPRASDSPARGTRASDAPERAAREGHATERAPRERDSRGARSNEGSARDARTSEARARAPRSSDAPHRAPRSTEPADDAPRASDPRARAPRTSDASERAPRASESSARAPRAHDTSERAPRSRDEGTRAPRPRDESSRAPRSSDASPRSSETRERAPRLRETSERAHAPRSDATPRDAKHGDRVRSDRPRHERDERPRRARSDDGSTGGAPTRAKRPADHGRDQGGFGSGL